VSPVMRLAEAPAHPRAARSSARARRTALRRSRTTVSSRWTIASNGRSPARRLSRRNVG